MRKLLCLILIAGTGCVRLQQSPFDTSQGGWLGALITALASPRPIVVVGAQGKAYTSYDGYSWTQRTITSDTSLDFYSVASTGIYFVAVGGTTSSTRAVIFTSSDGAVWTQALSLTGASPTYFADVISAGGKIVAVGGSGTTTPLIRTSGDAVNWSSGSIASVNRLARVTYDGTYFIVGDAIGSGGLSTFRSTDGISFTATPNLPFTGAKDAELGDLIAIGTRVIYAGTEASSTTSPSRSATTLNAGTTAWTTDSAGSQLFAANSSLQLARGLAYNGTRLLAVGDACRVDFTGNITSLSWTGSSLTMTGCSGTRWNGLLWDGSKFIAAGNGGRIAVSGTGASTDWSISSPSSTNLNGIAIR